MDPLLHGKRWMWPSLCGWPSLHCACLLLVGIHSRWSAKEGQVGAARTESPLLPLALHQHSPFGDFQATLTDLESSGSVDYEQPQALTGSSPNLFTQDVEGVVPRWADCSATDGHHAARTTHYGSLPQKSRDGRPQDENPVVHFFKNIVTPRTPPPSQGKGRGLSLSRFSWGAEGQKPGFGYGGRASDYKSTHKGLKGVHDAQGTLSRIFKLVK
ncbi:hypothetical protein HPG69_003638 [Diceros bicornis minor]|uniref:Myelin basic protein n=1 Tax=Diceros bicornis minor TaxID=77932 RepID=A0A7J7ETJ2_DICBM|nr:hypothetical protein HPG69_003638 [Diceros bicornis minor]